MGLFRCSTCGAINTHGKGDVVVSFKCWACGYVQHQNIIWVGYNPVPDFRSGQKVKNEMSLRPFWKHDV